MRHLSMAFVAILCTAIFTPSCNKQDLPAYTGSGNQDNVSANSNIKHHTAGVAVSWFQLHLQLIKADSRMVPPVAARTLGYAGFTLYETVVGSMPKYQSIAAYVNAPPLPAYPNHAINEYLAANKAMHNLLVQFFVYDGSPNPQAEAWCDHVYQTNLNMYAAGEPAHRIAQSEHYGQTLADAVYQWSATDPIGHMGQLHNTDPGYTGPMVPGAWQPTPPLYGMPVQPHWGNARVFVTGNNAGQCLPVLPVPFSTMPGSPFYDQAYQAYQTVNQLNDEQKAIALYWADGSGTITPPGHMISIATQVLIQKDASLDEAAETYCKTGMAVNDAFVACWKGKYLHFLQRPITYIRHHIDPTWNPLIVTPAFPSYASGHATQSGAACQVLSDLFGYQYAFTDHTNDALGFAPRSFDSFFDAAEEASISRLYGGIHYSMDNENGYASGLHIGMQISKIPFKKKEGNKSK